MVECNLAVRAINTHGSCPVSFMGKREQITDLKINRGRCYRLHQPVPAGCIANVGVIRRLVYRHPVTERSEVYGISTHSRTT
jgi:hypothetical protein